MADQLATQWFVRDLRRALRYLYVPAVLQKSPLLQLLGIDPGKGPLALRQVLLDAINALRPAPNTAPMAKARRVYDTLRHLYVEQFAQAEVAAAMSISTRHLRRQERVASQVLADYIWSRYNLGQVNGSAVAERKEIGAPAGDAGHPSREQELQWLERTLPREPADVPELLQTAEKVVTPLAHALGVHIQRTPLLTNIPSVAVQVPSMRQALLNVLTTAIRCVPHGQVAVDVETKGDQVSIAIRALAGQTAGAGAAREQHYDLSVAEQLIALSGGSLDVQPGAGQQQLFTVKLVLQAVGQMAVLFIDDNADTLQLLQRYLAGSPYTFIGCRNPAQVLDLATSIKPGIIVLDVMLPGIDGWELLGNLHEHPTTCNTPIIVCTILPEEQLASTLGAAAFIHKPLSQKALLSALDRQAALLATGSC